MNNLELLKQELLSQKDLIEKRGGVVVQAGTNPSPAEITEAIKTIAGSDLTLATAVEEDVRYGKTFYSGSPELKTGSANMDTESFNHIFTYVANEQSCDGDIYFTLPNHITSIKESMFSYNVNKITLTFSENIKTIGTSAFRGAKNFTFLNFSNLNQLLTISQYAFYGSGANGIDFYNLPNSITKIDAYAFESCLQANQSLKLPESLINWGQSAFKQSSRVQLNDFNISDSKITSFPNMAIYNLAFDCDLVVPSNVITIYNQFNYNGCFRNIVFHSEVMLYDNVFDASSYLPLSDFYLKSVVFEGESVPSLGNNMFAAQNITNGFKIYVPDNSIEEYKAASKLAKYINCIYPMSQKE